MKFSLKRLIPLAGLVLGILIVLIPFVISPVCTKLLELKSGAFTHMACHWTGTAEVIFGIFLTAVNLYLLIFGFSDKSGRFAGIIQVIIAAAGFAVIDSKIMGICRNPMMACNTTVKVLFPFLLLSALSGIVLIILSFRKEKP